MAMQLRAMLAALSRAGLGLAVTQYSLWINAQYKKWININKNIPAAAGIESYCLKMNFYLLMYIIELCIADRLR